MKSKPVEASRAEIIQWRLSNMIEFAKVVNEKWNASSGAVKDRYIRILGESCRAVSLNDNSPLCGFGDSGSKDVLKVIQHFDDANRQLRELAGKDWEIKKERRLQSWIIKQALINGRDLLQSPIFECLKESFDELIFSLDEVSFGDDKHKHPEAVVRVVGNKEISLPPKIVRCDLLAVGVKDGKVFPVVIELKTLRSLGRLIEQLENAEREISSHKEEIRSLMELTTGKKISDFAVRKVLVWPYGKESKSTADKRKDSGVFFVEYTPANFEHPSVLKAKLPKDN